MTRENWGKGQEFTKQSVVAIVATQFNFFHSASHQVHVSGFIFVNLEFQIRDVGGDSEVWNEAASNTTCRSSIWVESWMVQPSLPKRPYWAVQAVYPPSPHC